MAFIHGEYIKPIPTNWIECEYCGEMFLEDREEENNIICRCGVAWCCKDCAENDGFDDNDCNNCKE